jgi:hypothetical protein
MFEIEKESEGVRFQHTIKKIPDKLLSFANKLLRTFYILSAADFLATVKMQS